MIQLTNICKVYHTSTVETHALTDINLTVKAGEFLSIMGPSGCGKSTLLGITGLLDLPSSGQILINGVEVSRLSDQALASFRNEMLGFVFQGFHLINDLTVVDNVEIPLLYRRGISRHQRRQMAADALDKVGLSKRLLHYPSQLSGGQKQRVAIARALVGSPKVLLADEPTGNLDSAMSEEIMNLLQGINEHDGTTIVMVTHDKQMAYRTHTLLEISDGQAVSNTHTLTA